MTAIKIQIKFNPKKWAVFACLKEGLKSQMHPKIHTHHPEKNHNNRNLIILYSTP